MQADKSAFKAKKIGGPLPGNKLGAKNGTRGLRDAMQMETLDFNKKILHASWHPRENTIAVRFIPSFGCGCSVDIHIYSLDRCNEQPVLIQRGVIFVMVLVKSIVQMCRRRHCCPPFFPLVVVCFFLHSPIHFTVTVIYFSDAEYTLLYYCPPPLSSARSSLVPPSIIRRTNATSGPSPSPIFGSSLLHFTHLITLIPRPYPRAPTPPSAVFPLTRQEVRKRRITIRIRIRTYTFLETSPRLQ